ncbi:hypothetical protein CYMTET_23307 [Cymbomonas tetramitiformis]|uniref:ShKT domain-containing protein n=1 Tax=Cymbomonas tetramitiformis TaxID=36881 RepID=A0AAE0FYG2_9CHLO|nr:hypothetical protein CYMTET_23307 [Cymbomonas tetramitiformis]
MARSTLTRALVALGLVLSLASPSCGRVALSTGVHLQYPSKPTPFVSDEGERVAESLADYLSTTAEDYEKPLLWEAVSLQRSAVTLFDLKIKLQRRRGSAVVKDSVQATIVQTNEGELYLLHLKDNHPAGSAVLGNGSLAENEAARRSILQTDECIDDGDFRDEKAYPCSTWSGYNCSGAADWGYTEEGTADILENCEVSCGLCTLPPPPLSPLRLPSTPFSPPISDECTESSTFRDEKAYPCSTWSGYNCSGAADWGYTEEGTADILENCRLSCSLCNPFPPPPIPPYSPAGSHHSNCTTYISLSSGTCESSGLWPVLDGGECETASIEAGYSDGTVSNDYSRPAYPIGCYIFSSFGVERLWFNIPNDDVSFATCDASSICICSCTLPPPPPLFPPSDSVINGTTIVISNASTGAYQLDQAISMEFKEIVLETDITLLDPLPKIEYHVEVTGQCDRELCAIDAANCYDSDFFSGGNYDRCRIFDVDFRGGLILRSLILRNGKRARWTTGGGAIYTEGPLTIIGSILEANAAVRTCDVHLQRGESVWCAPAAR